MVRRYILTPDGAIDLPDEDDCTPLDYPDDDDQEDNDWEHWERCPGEPRAA